MADVVKRKLNELRVVDLRAELEKRNLDKTGVKATLFERLEQAMKNDGDDPETFQFAIVELKKLQKKKKGKDGDLNDAEGDEDDDEEQGVESLSDYGSLERRNETFDESSVERSDTNNTLSRRSNIDDDDELVVGIEGSVDVNDIDDEQIKVPNPENVEPQCPFTSEDTIKLHQVTSMKKNFSDLEGGGISDEANSLFVNPDETLSDLDQTETSSSFTAGLFSGNDGSLTMTDVGGNGKTTRVRHENESDIGSFDESNAKMNASSPTALSTPNENETEKTSSLKNEPKKENEDASEVADEPDDKKTNAKNATPSATTGKSMWVMGISSTTKAADLKALFSKYGRVATAKVISSKTKTDGCKWFGFITMATADDASKCIQHLHRTELHGKMISVERTSSNSTMPPKKVISAVNDGPASKRPTTVVPAVTTSNSSDANAHGNSSAVDTSSKAAKDETSVKLEDQAANNDEKTSETAEKKKDEVAERNKEKLEKRSSRSRTKSKSKERRRSSKERRSREREMARRREMANRSRRPPMNNNSRPPYRPRPPLMSGRLQRPPPAPMRRPPPNDYRRRDFEQTRLLEIRREREREMVERMRQKEAEHKRREEVLRLEREKERLKFEREKLEREKAELQYQQKHIIMQAAYEQRLQQQPNQMIGIKRPYDGGSGYGGPDPKRYSSSGVGPRSGRDRTPPRYGSGRDQSRNERYDSRDSRSGRVDPVRTSGRDDYRTGSSSSRRQEPVRSSRSGPSGRFASPPRRNREPPPPPPPPRPSASWRGAGSSSTTSRHTTGASRGSSGNVRDSRVPSSYSSHQSSSYTSRPPPTAPATWQPAPIVQNTTWGRPGQIQTAVSTGVWAPQAPNTLFGGVASNAVPSNSSYTTDNRFDAYKYNSSANVRRYQ